MYLLLLNINIPVHGGEKVVETPYITPPTLVVKLSRITNTYNLKFLTAKHITKKNPITEYCSTNERRDHLRGCYSKWDLKYYFVK